MNWDQMNQALDDARETIRRADAVVNQMARAVAGRLRKGNVDPVVLETLKRELANYNIHTMKWKGDK